MLLPVIYRACLPRHDLKCVGSDVQIVRALPPSLSMGAWQRSLRPA